MVYYGVETGVFWRSKLLYYSLRIKEELKLME